MTTISAAGAAPTSPALRQVDPSMYRPKLLQVGVITWLASELMFFSGLFAAYFSLRAATHPWPPKGDTLDVPPVLVATILLVLSSFTMQYGVYRAARGSKWGFIGWTALTFALGALFEGMQISDYLGRPFAISRDGYSSAFYTLTGFHFLHVAGGLIGMVIVSVRVLTTPRFGHRTMPAIEMLSYYWHFVDVVWIALFLVIFVLK
ncbi:MAG TPA: heme-copper oxidase subunit III [Acidimicrobiales bacterium]|nr:heme-copper oxidase subunit III [Acidimicrobiales bacterium]